MKRLIPFFIVMLMLISLVPATAAADASSSRVMSPEEVIKKMVAAQNDKDWATFSSVWSDEWQKEFKLYFGCKDNPNGYLGVISAKLVSIYELSPSQVKSACAGLVDIDAYSDVKAFIVGIDYKVKNESTFYYNGVNYRMPVLAQIDGTWKIVMEPEPDIKDLISYGAVHRSDDVNIAIEIRNARHQGYVLNASGKTIDVIVENPHPLTRATFYTCTHNRPSLIVIYRTATGATTYSEVRAYVCNVVPNEWVSSWGLESVSAGIVACENLGVFRVLYRLKYPGAGYHVKDDNSDQVYVPGTSNSYVVNAWNNSGNYHFETGSGNQWYVEHKQGLSGYPGPSASNNGDSCGTIYQYGTKYLQDYQSMDWEDMLHYYLDCSGNLGSTANIQIVQYN